MSYRFRQFHIRDNMLQSIIDYINKGWHPGEFLESVICNNLKESVWKADEENMENLPAFVAFLYNDAPSMCWGSKEKFDKWMSHQGLRGIDARIEDPENGDKNDE